ncbi:hypothetical protein [Microbacterium sp. LWH12-1.2]|uniref:hypothetical protein n=1 Tax=Microbacterium sp. LWH12-1.2 TaxID=3135259 RepID=UPI0034234125
MAPLPIAPVVSELLTAIGQVGVWTAVLGAVALSVAIAFDAAGLAGGAAAIWLTGGILGLALWHSGDGMTPLASGFALLLAVGVGAAWRSARRRAVWRRIRSALARPTTTFPRMKREPAPTPVPVLVVSSLHGAQPRPVLER